jgi:hypothetical protein
MHDLSTGGQLARKFQLVHSPGLVWACSGIIVAIGRGGSAAVTCAVVSCACVEQFAAEFRGNTRVRLFRSSATKQREK